MNFRVLNAVGGRLSLRAPQAESLQRLAAALEAAPGYVAAGESYQRCEIIGVSRSIDA